MDDDDLMRLKDKVEYLQEHARAVDCFLNEIYPDQIGDPMVFGGVRSWYRRKQYAEEQKRILELKIEELTSAGYTVTKKESNDSN